MAANNEILSCLKNNDKGWNIDLFEDQTKIAAYICAHCGSVCCDAVELACIHNEDDIYKYCQQCLNYLITINKNKCPIKLHSGPTIVPVRSTRREISSLTVYCPHSDRYQEAKNDGNHNHHDLLDTMDHDEHEGNNLLVHQPDNDENKIECHWKGSLNQLIQEHLIACIQNDITNMKLDNNINVMQDPDFFSQHKLAICYMVNQHPQPNKQLQISKNQTIEDKDSYKRKHILLCSAILICLILSIVGILIPFVVKYFFNVAELNANTQFPTHFPTFPTLYPTINPTVTSFPPTQDTTNPTVSPTESTLIPSQNPTNDPSVTPTIKPTNSPTSNPSAQPTTSPTLEPTISPTVHPTIEQTNDPTISPTTVPTIHPTTVPTSHPTGSAIKMQCPMFIYYVWTIMVLLSQMNV